MNQLKTILFGLSLIFLFSGCDDEIGQLQPPTAPTNLEVTVSVADDRSGNVTFAPTANGALSFRILPGDGAEVDIQPGETYTHPYSGSGQFTVTAVIIAFGTGGASSSVSQNIELDIELQIDPALLTILAGGTENSTRRWVWNSDIGGVDGHFGVGEPGLDFPNFFAASANQLADCLYDDVIEFSTNELGALSYTLITQGVSFLNSDQVGVLFPGEGGNGDECREADDLLTLETAVNIIPVDGGNSTLSLGGGALSPLSYFANVAQWEITEISDNIFRVRGINVPGDLAWYHSFIPEDAAGEPGERIFDTSNLIFADEFDLDGAPDSTVWNFRIGDGCNFPQFGGCGWGNQEAQYYTDRPENIIIQDGMLQITARRETLGTRDFTSARIDTQNNFDFTFGRVDFRARVPVVGGTWVATWMLGADIDTNPWPGPGEIDVMEHVGNQLNRIFGTTHSPAGFGGTAFGSSTIIPDATTEFHVYSVDWTENMVIFYVDDVEYFRYAPSEINEMTFPFDSDFFLLINFAMGGTFGQDIDPNFTEETVEIDYVRVYQ